MSKKNSAPSQGQPTSRREQLRLQQEAAAKQQRTMRIIGIAAAVLAVVLVAIVATVLVNNNRNKVEAADKLGTPPHANADKTGITVYPGKAKEGAPVVALYLDYQCPNCKQAEQFFGPMFESLANKGEINFEYRTMTFMDTGLQNTASKRAAIAAACSDWSGTYAKYHMEVMNNQSAQEVRGSEGYSDKLLRDEIPAKVGITGQQLTDFQTCYDNRATENFVAGTDDKAGAAGVTGTPTLTVNGKKLGLDQLGQDEASMLAAIKKAAA